MCTHIDFDKKYYKEFKKWYIQKDKGLKTQGNIL
jgi:hypothetical protein